MRSLVDKGLVTISYENKVEMHDLIQEMVWEIVRQESIEDPELRSRLWESEDVYHVLRNNMGTGAIEGIVLDAYEFGDLHLEPDVFKKMIKLRFLKFGGDRSGKFKFYIPSHLESLPDNLRYFYWSKYPLKSLPSTFNPEKLVELEMPSCRVEKLWDGVQNLANLETISLVYSQNLLELPDLSRATNLKCMDLSGCTILRDVHPSILRLPKLEILFVAECKALKSLKSNIHSTSLKVVSAWHCSSLQEFSVTSENLVSLDLSFTAIDELPPSILLLKKVEKLDFQVSESLNKLPDKLVNSLNLRGCCQRELPTLRIILDRWWYLKELNLYRSTLSELPDNINQLISLQYLHLMKSHLVTLPENIRHLSQLVGLSVNNCVKLESLPELPPSIEFLDATNCTSLETLCGLTEPLEEYIKPLFMFENCIKLGERALNSIKADAHMRIKGAANNLFAALAIEEQEQEKGNLDNEENTNSYDKEYVQVCICFPGSKLPDWFSYCSEQPFLHVEIPSYSHFLGFAFCVIIPKVESDAMDDILNIGCECCLIGSNGEIIINFESWLDNVHHRKYWYVQNSYLVGKDKPLADHVYIWYDSIACHYYFQIMDAIKHKRTGDHMKFSFTFLVETVDANRARWLRFLGRRGELNQKQVVKTAVMIRSCGVQPIYALENHPNRGVESDELDSLPKITRKTIFPTHSSGNWKQDENRGLKQILSLDCGIGSFL